MSRWERLESKAQSIDLTGGIEARIADPLWMLARQWQVLEFEGDDAAHPAAVRITGQNLPLTGFKGLTGGWKYQHNQTPLETLVEATPGPDFGAAGLHGMAAASRRLFRMLAEKALAKAIPRLREEYSISLPEQMVQPNPASAQLALLLARCAINAAEGASANDEGLKAVLAGVLGEAETGKAITVINAWRIW